MKNINHMMRPAPNVPSLSAKLRFLAREYIADFSEIGWCNVFFLNLSSISTEVKTPACLVYTRLEFHKF
jgi:hypothetical protein